MGGEARKPRPPCPQDFSWGEQDAAHWPDRPPSPSALNSIVIARRMELRSHATQVAMAARDAGGARSRCAASWQHLNALQGVRRTLSGPGPQPHYIVELHPEVEDREPVAQSADSDQAAPVDEPEAEQPEPQSRSRGFSLNEVRLIGRIAKDAAVHPMPGGTKVGYLRVATNGRGTATPSSTS